MFTSPFLQIQVKFQVFEVQVQSKFQVHVSGDLRATQVQVADWGPYLSLKAKLLMLKTHNA